MNIEVLIVDFPRMARMEFVDSCKMSESERPDNSIKETTRLEQRDEG